MTSYPPGTLALLDTNAGKVGGQRMAEGCWALESSTGRSVLEDNQVLGVSLLHLPEPELFHEDVLSASEVLKQFITSRNAHLDHLDYFGAARAVLLDYARKEQTR